MTDKIKDLATLQQGSEERFAIFEIRIRKALADILHSGCGEEDIVHDLITNKVRDFRLREVLLTKPETKMEETRNLAKIFESSEKTEGYVKAIDQRTYARVAERGTKEVQNTVPYSKNIIEPSRNEYNQRATEQHGNYRGRREQFQREDYRRSERGNNFSEQTLPTVSMKFIAKRLYNESRGLPSPPIQKLTVGDCFCCGEKGHRRHECPLRNKCLICGKEGHIFRNCLSLRRETPRQFQRVACIEEEVLKTNEQNERHNEGNFNSDSYNIDDRYDVPERYSEMRGETKNTNDSMGFISSVESRE